MPHSERIVFWSTLAITAVIWIFQALHWNSLLDGDAALYQLMSMEVLKGHHYLYTAGQSHGGTPLVYLRAILFAAFGPSHFLGFYLNGIITALAAALWAKIACRLAGPLAGAVFGVLAALGNEVFAQYSLTDYYVLSLLLGGMMLQLALVFAKRDELKRMDFFALGLIASFSFYVCRFTPLYFLLAGGIYYWAASPTMRAALVPSWRELWRSRGRVGWVSRVLASAAAICAALSIPAFFTNDAFFGVNAETSLKLAAKLALALWALHRWRLLLVSPVKCAATAFGAMLGMLPHFLFNWTNPEKVDRATGLVRWSDLAGVLHDMPATIGASFTRAAPMTYGLAAAIASILVLGMGFYGHDARSRRLYTTVLLGALPCVASWFLIHTYMYFKVQYFYPVYFPLYFALALAVSTTRLRPLALVLVSIVALGGVYDLKINLTKPNHRLASGVLEKMREWKVDKSTGEYDSTYDLMWAYKGAVLLDPIGGTSRFPRFKALLEREDRIAYIRRDNESLPIQLNELYTVLRSEKLNEDYAVDLLKKKN